MLDSGAWTERWGLFSSSRSFLRSTLYQYSRPRQRAGWASWRTARKMGLMGSLIPLTQVRGPRRGLLVLQSLLMGFEKVSRTRCLELERRQVLPDVPSMATCSIFPTFHNYFAFAYQLSLLIWPRRSIYCHMQPSPTLWFHLWNVRDLRRSE
ncbi:uncharacterized protein BCR38DRAFT_168605 [Pseudomassariella vexata]|uniref:Uncharacterized protein n=1 Tax=Pseudomassariella vexata TaxID=1141098 RepID=A0A1Y2E3G7_9PEZI|nr:uncharacterized protein BCR38DRAFT_168605 [Pseudomassariella vexata]ORY65904.1 hypothetical protein BCR38DRAFT_168605 [Pseudomassariella vexata]